jgi:CDGSH-type Zn-finger protein
VISFGPHCRLVVEADSFGWHSSPDALNDDRERDVELTLAGYHDCASRTSRSRSARKPSERAPHRVPRAAMADDVTITPYRDGPLLVRGPFRLLDQQGREIEAGRETVALCRCGKSRLRPFCDGTHKLVRFKAPSAAEAGRET